jgi:hypothetical protein
LACRRHLGIIRTLIAPIIIYEMSGKSGCRSVGGAGELASERSLVVVL